MSSPDTHTTLLTAGEAARDMRAHLVAALLNRMIEVGFYGPNKQVHQHLQDGQVHVSVVDTATNPLHHVVTFRMDTGPNIWGPHEREMTDIVSAFAVAFGLLTGPISTPTSSTSG